MDTERTWAEIDLDNIEHNFREMKAKLGEDTRFLGVVKADAYGHGANRVAAVLQEAGCDYFAVACLDEALRLRAGGAMLPILILGYTSPERTPELIAYDITQAVSSFAMAKEMSLIACSLGKTLKVHLKADSGMGRMGFTCHDGRDPAPEMAEIMRLPNLDFEGIFTHFAVSDVAGGEEYTEMQFAAFTSLADRLETLSGKKFRIRHCTNSGAMINYKKTYLDMVRPGIALYGCYPDKDRGDLELRPVMQLKTRIYQIKDFEAGDTVSYGRLYTAPSARRIAVIPIGYADGLHRVLSGKLEMLVRGKRVPQVGRICMDMCMLDVTDVKGVSLGDVVTVFGRDGDGFIPVEEPAEKAGTISYEILCDVSPRVPRIYFRHGRRIL